MDILFDYRWASNFLTEVLLDHLVLRQLGFPGSGLHDHAGVHLEPEEPFHPDELLGSDELPGSLLALGAAGLLGAAWQFDHRRFYR